jgi:hypothetical protein
LLLNPATQRYHDRPDPYQSNKLINNSRLIEDVATAWKKPDSLVRYHSDGVVSQVSTPAPVLHTFNVTKKAAIASFNNEDGYIKHFYTVYGPDLIVFVSFHVSNYGRQS